MQVKLPSSLVSAVSPCGNFLPASYVRWLALNLVQAGRYHRTALQELMTLKICAFIGTVGLALILPSTQLAVIALGVFMIPDALLAADVRLRQKALLKPLPNVLDLMVLCVDAGLGLEATIHRIARFGNPSDPLQSELNLLSNDLLFGMPQHQAYRELFHRTGVEELRSLGSALHQSARSGISIAAVLRSQSDFLRDRLARKAEGRANQLPVLMAFPLVLCTLPAVLIVLIAPPLLQHLNLLHTWLGH